MVCPAETRFVRPSSFRTRTHVCLSTCVWQLLHLYADSVLTDSTRQLAGKLWPGNLTRDLLQQTASPLSLLFLVCLNSKTSAQRAAHASEVKDAALLNFVRFSTYSEDDEEPARLACTPTHVKIRDLDSAAQEIISMSPCISGACPIMPLSSSCCQLPS